MSDFIFSNDKKNRQKMSRAICEIYHKETPNTSYFSGTWGSLIVTKNIYNGFDPYETKEYLAIVIGGPVLMFRNNSFINDSASNEGTAAIFDRWKSNHICWDEDLNGPFVVLIINKVSHEVLVTTDIMSFIPIYEHRLDKTYSLSSHVDALAKIADKDSCYDNVSIIDFILHGTVTYPHTVYNSIYQIPPASEHYYQKGADKTKSKGYWEPYETNKYASIDETARLIRSELERYIRVVTDETQNVAQFISAGEDSRTLSGLLKNINRDSYIYLDAMNREGKIARKIARKYNSNFLLSTRDQFHYLHILEECSTLLGTGAEYHHAHTYGFHKDLKKYDAVFGGLFSDALLKGSRIKKTRITKKLPFLPQRRDKRLLVNENLEGKSIPIVILNELKKRRMKHLEFVKKYRIESSEEWFELWPSSMNRNIPNIYANRRLFKSYEPFLSNEIVKISAALPQKWKLNRRLFHKVAKPYLKPSRWILHGEGWLPYFPWHLNVPIHFNTWFYRQLINKLGFIRGNQGPWAEWKVIVGSKRWDNRVERYFNNLKDGSSKSKLLLDMLKNDKQLTVLQHISLTQMLWHLQNKH